MRYAGCRRLRRCSVSSVAGVWGRDQANGNDLSDHDRIGMDRDERLSLDPTHLDQVMTSTNHTHTVRPRG